jgi:hypothetical protein
MDPADPAIQPDHHWAGYGLWHLWSADRHPTCEASLLFPVLLHAGVAPTESRGEAGSMNHLEGRRERIMPVIFCVLVSVAWVGLIWGFFEALMFLAGG